MTLLFLLSLGVAYAGESASWDDDASDGAPEPVDVEEPGTAPIWNGELTTDFPEVVALANFLGDSFQGTFCSGTYIADRWVVTAGHCVTAARDAERSGYAVYVLFGDDIVDDGWWYRIRATGLHVHPSYGGAPLRNDIGLVEMERAHPWVQPAVINDEPVDRTWIGTELQFVGFGVTSDRAQDGGAKHTARIDYDDASATVIASYDGESNVCYGDSGGAAFEITAQGFELAGVNSYVTPSCVRGGNGATRVDAYVSWIDGFTHDFRTEPYPPVAEEVSLWSEAGRPPEDVYVSGACGNTPWRVGWVALLPALLLRRRR